MKTYTVVTGDSLSKIARDVLGDMSLWGELARINNIQAPYVIYPGQTLNIDVHGETFAPASSTAGSSSSAGSSGAAATDDATKLKRGLWIIGGVIVVLAIIVIAIKTHQRWLRK